MTGHRGLIPIYDATAPIACTLTAREAQERRQVLEWLRTRLTRVERTEHGMLLHLPPGREVVAELERFAHLEKQCCGFWGFDVQSGRSTTTLRWDAPPAAEDLFESFLAWFQGDPHQDLTHLL